MKSEGKVGFIEFVVVYVVFLFLLVLAVKLEKYLKEVNWKDFLENNVFLSLGVLIGFISVILYLMQIREFAFLMLYGGIIGCFYYLVFWGISAILKRKRND